MRAKAATVPEEIRFFARVALFTAVITAIYWFVSYEEAGTLLLGGGYARIERFAKRFDIAVAIHNHGPEDKHFPAPSDALKLIKGRRRTSMLALCALVWSASWAVIASSDAVDGWVAVMLVVVGLGLFGLGETLWAPTGSTPTDSPSAAAGSASTTDSSPSRSKPCAARCQR